MFRRPPMVCPDAHTLCILDLLMAKDFKASGLHVSELSIALPWIPKNSPQSWIALVIKKAIKTPKLNTIWLELIVRVLNMPIRLKGNKYYSKVFKRVNYKLWNSIFWVVINVLRRELEALRQGPEESVTSFIPRWREKIAQIVDCPSKKDQISMILRSLQPIFARHLMGFSHMDFGSLV